MDGAKRKRAFTTPCDRRYKGGVTAMLKKCMAFKLYAVPILIDPLGSLS